MTGPELISVCERISTYAFLGMLLEESAELCRDRLDEPGMAEAIDKVIAKVKRRAEGVQREAKRRLGGGS